MSVKVSEGDLGVEKSKYRKPRNHSGGQITQELFLTFLRPGQPRQSWCRLVWMVQGWGRGLWQEAVAKVDGQTRLLLCLRPTSDRRRLDTQTHLPSAAVVEYV